jgi:hypothetical protein
VALILAGQGIHYLAGPPGEENDPGWRVPCRRLPTSRINHRTRSPSDFGRKAPDGVAPPRSNFLLTREVFLKHEYPQASGRQFHVLFERASTLDSPEAKLWVAVLNQAVGDLVKRLPKSELCHKESAKRLFSGGRDLDLICERAGLDSEWVRETVQRHSRPSV